MAITQAEEQAQIWNGRAGTAWVNAQELLDGLFEPFERLLGDALSGLPAARVLDVGCGTGSTTLAVARRLASPPLCLGIDLSEPMISLAQQRAEREDAAVVRFVRADAQQFRFEEASFDAIISRFGVMFFEDPVAAFRNLRSAAADNALLCCIAWRSAAENPFMTTAERAAAPFLPNMPVRRPDAPGQFAFADADRVRGILEASGWSDIDIQPIDVPCSMPAAALRQYVTTLGPVGMALQDADEATRSRVTELVSAAFQPYVHGERVELGAACWRIGARAAG